MDNGEVIALLDIAKCLYDAIARMERAAEKGKAIAAAVEGVEKNWGTSFSGWWKMILQTLDHFLFFSQNFLLYTAVQNIYNYMFLFFWVDVQDLIHSLRHLGSGCLNRLYLQ